MTTLLLARHGETIWHREHRYAGSTDVPLTDAGLAQAAVLAQWAASAGLDAVVSSSLSRARDIAAPAAAAAGVELRIDARLVEVDFGEAEGLSPDEIAERMPQAHAAWDTSPARHPLLEGERGLDALARAKLAIDDLLAEFGVGGSTIGGTPESRSGPRVLVVTHGTLLRLLWCDWLGVDPDEYRRRFPEALNCALWSVRFEHLDGRVIPRMVGMNVPPVHTGP